LTKNGDVEKKQKYEKEKTNTLNMLDYLDHCFTVEREGGKRKVTHVFTK